MARHLTQELQAEAVKLLSSGCFFDEASAAMGLPRSTFTTWIRKGEDLIQRASNGYEPIPDEIKYMRFAEEVRTAHALAIVNAHARIQDAMRGGPSEFRPAIWYLAVRNPNRYAAWTRRLDALPTVAQQEGMEDPEDRADVASEADRKAVVVSLRSIRDEKRREQATG